MLGHIAGAALAYHRRTDLPKDFGLLVAACGAAFRPPRDPGPEPAPGDWGGFLALVDRHRVPGLAARGLPRLGLSVPPVLAERARRNAADNLRAADDCARIEQRFAGAGIDRLWFKGLTLSMLAYGDPFLKTSADIDLLVAPADVAAAERLLSEIGYRPADPRFRPAMKARTWLRTDGAAVDLHVRLTENPGYADGAGLASARQRVEIAVGLALETLANETLLPYLAMHGTYSLWNRLKWVADFAALQRRIGGQALRRTRALAVASMLADQLFATGGAVPQADRIERLLLRMARRQLTERREPTARPFGTVTIHLAGVLVGDTPSIAAGEAVRQLRLALSR